MPDFVWKGVNFRGVKKKGKLEADNEQVVEAHLKRLRITPTQIKPAPKDLFESIKFLQPKPNQKDLITFTMNFSTMFDAGLTLVKCLEILAGQAENKILKSALRDILSNVTSGSTFSEGLKKYPKIFDDLYCNLVAAGEEGGILENILKRLATHIQNSARIKAKMKGAMIMPMITVVAGVAVTTLMLYFVIPVFAEMFAGMGATLPLPTRVMVILSDFLRGNIIYIIVCFVVFIFLFRRFRATERGQVIWDRVMLQAPIFGNLQRIYAVAHFTRTLSTMLAAGVPIMDALDITASTAGNKIIEQSVIDTRNAISEGRGIAETMSESGVFPTMVIQMITVGEEAGALETMLGHIADAYDEEVENAVEALTKAIEPLMFIMLGTLVGGMMMAMYMPMFQIGDLV